MKLAIVGFGRFGQLWANSLLPFGDVSVYDQNVIHLPAESRIKIITLSDLASADVVFVVAPISAFEACCLAIQKVLNPTTLVVDCCSVKMFPVEVMRRVFSATQPLLATHPLFGPVAVKKSGGLVGHKIVVCPLQQAGNKQNQVQEIFKQMGLKILITTPEEHDHQMANSQGLVHFIGRGLTALDLHPQELATPDFQALLNINNMVANNTWQLFLDMHQYNPYVKAIRQKFIEQLISLDQKIEEHAQVR